MQEISRSNRYDVVSKGFHWVTAIIVFAAFVLGPGDFGHLIDAGIDPGTRWDIVLHESLGISVFAITLMRLIWIAMRAGAPKHEMARWMLLASNLTHFVLWGLLFALPVSALLALGSEGNPLTLLGGFRIGQIPMIAASGIASLADWGEVHKFLGDVIIWLAGIHAFAALYHHFRLKDKVLNSMLP